LHGLDKAKYLLVVAEIQKHLNKKIEDSVLKQLINLHGGNSEDWKRIEQKYLEILKRDLWFA